MATADMPRTDATKLDELIPLLQEYSGKLRERSERIMLAVAQRNSQRQSLVLAAVIGACTAVVAGLILQPVSWLNPGNVLGACVSVAATVLAVAATRERTTFQDRLRALVGGNHPLSPEELSIHVRDVQILAEQVGKLIRRVSQLDEHHAHDFSDRVELELRLTEAEIAVTYVNEVVLPAAASRAKRSAASTTTVS